MATIYEVSALAGVSLATVSRVINNSGKVTEKTRQKVLSAIKQLDYRPNSMAQSLASKRSNSVGVLIPELYGPYFGDLLSSIETALHGAGKRVIVTAGHSDESKEKDCIDFLLGSSCDALILHVHAVSPDYIVKVSQGSVAVILLNGFIEEMADRCFNVDNEYGGYVATKSLVDRGHSDLAYISGPVWKTDSFKRLAGHKRALQESGLEPDSRLIIEGDFEEASGRAAMIQLLDQGVAFTGVVCANDEMAAGAMDAARENGLTIPGDISIIGYDDVYFTRYLNPKLSSIGVHTSEMGQMAARCVLKCAYDQPELEIQNSFKPYPVLRESVNSR